MFNYGVGGNEVKVDANEAIQEIQGNKSLLVAKLTTDDAIAPEIVTGLKTVEEVFHYFTPSLEMEHETADGQSVKEVFRFNNLGDFTPKKMVENSPFLKGLKVDEEQYNKIVKQMQVNKVLRKVLEDQEAKREFADTLRAIAEELEK
nr:MULTISPECIES: type VI secretion system contractile sheath small subunit [unclassified Myroides]